MKKKSNLDILMIMFGFTFFSGSMLIGQKLSSGVEFSDFLVCILIGGTILSIFGGILGYIGAKTGNNMKELSHKSFGKKGSYLPSLLVGITQIGWYGVGISMFAVPVANLIFPNNIFALIFINNFIWCIYDYIDLYWYRFNYEGELFSSNCYFIIWFYIHNLCI